MTLGTMAGLAMGRSRAADRIGDPWLVVLLNLPALVIIVLAYIWAGLQAETAAITARRVALNKLPLVTVTVREGARFPGSPNSKRWRRCSAYVERDGRTGYAIIIMPQLAPYIAAAARSGLSLVWKIVLIVELLGRSNGVGFEIGVAFQLFDVTLILAYALAFVAVMLVIEYISGCGHLNDMSLGGAPTHSLTSGLRKKPLARRWAAQRCVIADLAISPGLTASSAR